MKVMVIGAHADDPEVSMGGTIAKLVRQNCEVKIVTAIIPCENIDGCPSTERKEERWRECENSAKVLNAKLQILDLDPNEMQFKRSLVKLLDHEIRAFSPEIVFTHWNYDSHQDHVAISKATFSATRKNNISLMMYEQSTLGGMTPHSFNGNIFVDISNEIEIKFNGVRAYASQIRGRKDGLLEAIKGLAAYRGFQIGVKYAEAFQPVRVLMKIENNSCSLYGIKR